MITKEDISSKKIFLSKQLLTDRELADLWILANSCQYEYGHASDVLSCRVQRRMIHRIDPDAFVLTKLWQKLEKLFAQKIGLSEIYINYSESSTVTLPHCDNTDDDPSILICLNQEWNRDWGGYTVFFKKITSDEVFKTIIPSPGQVAIFNGSMCHYALPIVGFSPYPRFMLALKLKYL